MIDTTAAVKPDIADSLDTLYKDILLLLDRIIQQMAQWEVTS